MCFASSLYRPLRYERDWFVCASGPPESAPPAVATRFSIASPQRTWPCTLPDVTDSCASGWATASTIRFPLGFGASGSRPQPRTFEVVNSFGGGVLCVVRSTTPRSTDVSTSSEPPRTLTRTVCRCVRWIGCAVSFPNVTAPMAKVARPVAENSSRAIFFSGCGFSHGNSHQ